MSEKKQTSLDEWYKSNNEQLEKNRQKQLEETYINKELMAKYLGQDMKVSGLSDSGIAELYKQKSNTDYMNNRAQVNSNYEAQQQSLSNQYFAAKKEEEDIANAKLEQEKKEAQAKLEKEQNDMFQMYVNKVDNSLNQYGYLDDEVKSQLSEYFNRDSIGEHYSSLLDEYMNGYTPNAEQKAYIEEQEAAKEYVPYYDDEANKFTDGIYGMLDENGKITQEEATELYKKLEENRKLVGEDNYMAIYRGIKEMTETTEEANKRVEKETAVKNVNKRAEIERLGGIESHNGISVDAANSNSFGSYKSGKDQTNWVNEVINRAKNGKLKNGDLIDFNYGANASSAGSVYLYYDGKFYKTNKRASEANIQSDGFAEDGIWEWLLPWM